MLGLSTDPTFNNEDDDYEEASLLHITENALGQCGVGVQSTLTAADATHMLQVSRYSGRTFVNAKHEPHAYAVQTVLHTDMKTDVSFLPYCFSCCCHCIHHPVSCAECYSKTG